MPTRRCHQRLVNSTNDRNPTDGHRSSTRTSSCESTALSSSTPKSERRRPRGDRTPTSGPEGPKSTAKPVARVSRGGRRPTATSPPRRGRHDTSAPSPALRQRRTVGRLARALKSSRLASEDHACQERSITAFPLDPFDLRHARWRSMTPRRRRREPRLQRCSMNGPDRASSRARAEKAPKVLRPGTLARLRVPRRVARRPLRPVAVPLAGRPLLATSPS